MPPPCPPVSPPPPAERTIARSRSRYKGPRPQKVLNSLSEPPSFSAEQLERLHNSALYPREPRPQNDTEYRGRPKRQPTCPETTQRHRDFAGDAQRSDVSVAQKPGSSEKAKNPTDLHDWPGSPSQPLHGYQQSCPGRSGADAELHKEAGQDTVPSQKKSTSIEQYSCNQGPDLYSLHKEGMAVTIRSLVSPRNGLTHRTAGHSNGKRLRKGREEFKRTISAPITTESLQNVAKPAFDAPVSAVNAGERRVKVIYDQKLISLSVTPLTTPMEIICSASDRLAESIDPNNTLLLESFKQLGLERPLRRYEHVRDVLNSWDNDTQNILVIKPSPTVGRDDWLDIHSVSTSQLVDTSVYIHYSQRPGHWDKRWVTLRTDGQMLVAKRAGGENANICHMSDFDVYIPTARQSAKRIRPPRKICFAVKSQQKSSMFLSTANFVHFFSTSDKTLAATWYKAVLEWRSWYLVNIMGEGEEAPQEYRRVSTKVDAQRFSNTGSSKVESQRRPPEPPSQAVRTKRARGLVNYDTEHLAPFTTPNYRHSVAKTLVDDMPVRSRSKNHSSQSEKLNKDADSGASREHGPSFRQVIRSEDPEPFAASGLLGRTYSHRQKVQREREKAQKANSYQPTATPNVNSVSHLDQMSSQRPKPKPLIDLTPQYQEPPQHARKGRGIILEQIPAGGLVEVANTPEAAIAIPPSTTWRRPASRSGDGPSIVRSKTVQRDQSSRSPSKPKQTSTSSEKGELVFTGGLIANNVRGQGGARTGWGIMTGDRHAKEPMLGVGAVCAIERVERQDGDVHPIRGREERREEKSLQV